MQPVAIVGVGRTDYTPKPNVSIPEMVHQAVQTTLTDAELIIDQIDAVVTASVDLYDGLTASNLAVTEVVGAVMKPETRVAGDGLLAVCQGAMSILAGGNKTVLIVAHSKASMGERLGISSWTFDPVFQQPLGLDDHSAAALQASLLTEPFHPPTLEDSSGPDGAAAIILSSEPESISVRGMGWALDEHYLGDRNLSDSPALRSAARHAYNLAGISNPEKEISFAELSDYFAYQHELWTTVLGIKSDSQATPSEGLWGSVPPFVAGLDRLIKAVLRLRSNPGIGIAHGCWGAAGQGQVVVVVER